VPPYLKDDTVVADGDAAGGLIQPHTTVAPIRPGRLAGPHRHCLLLLLLLLV